jgi:membrane-bound serine protease (ClpP class)
MSPIRSSRGKTTKTVKLVLVFLLFFATSPALRAQTEAPESGEKGGAIVLRIVGPIGPAAADYIEHGFETARSQGALLVVLTMDTPGGLAESMRSIIREILNSPVPAAGFVHPPGARAASAGTYILYASHIAAMAPGTNLGAATPVRIGGGGMPFPGKEEKPPAEDDKGPSEEKPSRDAMEAKMVNDAAAYIRSLADMRGRNADWAEQSVREGVSLPVNEALEKNVIDVIASDVEELLRKIHGRQATVDGRRITLQTSGLKPRTLEPGWRIKLLAIITNPNIAFLLLLAGVYGLVFEFANPGSIGPGVVGVICLLLGLYALNVLPLNYAGLGLLLFSISLMVAEAFAPSFGVLGVGGIAAFVLAATMLFDSDIPGFKVSWPVIFGAAAVTAGLMIFLLGYAWKAQRRPVTTGTKSWIGKEATVVEWSGGAGYVHFGGERWKAVGKEDISLNDRVEVRDVKGLVLAVRKKKT